MNIFDSVIVEILVVDMKKRTVFTEFRTLFRSILNG